MSFFHTQCFLRQLSEKGRFLIIDLVFARDAAKIFTVLFEEREQNRFEQTEKIYSQILLILHGWPCTQNLGQIE